MSSVAKLTIEIAANIARLQSDMGKVKSTVEGAMGSVKSSINGVKAGIAGLVAGLSLGAMTGFVKQAIDAADAMDDLSQRIGVGVKDLAGLQLAFRFGGVEAASMQTAMVRLASEASKNSEVFKVLGVSVKSSDGSLKSSRDLLGEVAEKFQGLDDGARKTALAVEIFGKSGADLIPLLNGGAEGLAEFDATAAKLGLTISSETAAQAGQFNDTLDLMGQGIQGIGMQVAAQLLPTMTSLAGTFLGAFTEGNRLSGLSGALAVAMKGIAAAVIVVVDVFRMAVRGISAFGSAISALTSGDFSGAAKALASGFTDNLDIARESINSIKTVFSGTGGEAVAAIAKINNAQTTLNETGTKGVKVNKDLVDQVKALAKAREDHENYLQRQSDAETDSTEKIREQVAEVRQQIEVLGLTSSELQDLEQVKLNDAIATLEMKIALAEFGAENRALIPAFESQIQALKDLKAAKADLSSRQGEQESIKAAIKISEEQAKEAVKSFESITGDIAQAITNGIADGSIKGQDFLKRLFKTTAVRVGIEPFIKGAIGSLFGALGFGGMANASGGVAEAIGGVSGGLGGLVSGVKSVYDVFSNGFTGISDTLGNGFASLGDFISNNTGFKDLAAVFQDNAVTLGQYTSAIGIAIGGRSVGKLASGGYAIGGGSGNSAINFGGAIGAGLGGTLGVLGAAAGPIGALIGAGIGQALGGVVNRLFGRKTVLGASGIEGNFNPDGLSNARGFQDVTQKGGFFRSDKSFTNFFGIDTKAIDAVNQAFLDVRQSVEMASNALSADFVGGLANLNLTGRLGADLQVVLSNASDELVKEIIKASTGINADFLEFLEGIKQESEKLVDTFVRVSRGVSTANRAMLLLGQTAQFSINNAETALGLITTLGDSGIALLEQFVQNFVPVEEQFKRQVALFEQTVRELGLDTKVSINTTREEFAKLVQGIDQTTAAGQRELALLLQIMPQLSTLITKREQEKAATQALSKAIESNVAKIKGDFRSLVSVIQNRADSLSAVSFGTAIGSVQSALNGLTAQPVINFSDLLSRAVPTDTAYRGFISSIGQLQPETAKYLNFVDSISGFTPNTSAYKAFSDAVSGIKPTQDAYQAFVSSVQGLKPSDALYQAFVGAVNSTTFNAGNYTGFKNAIQQATDSVSSSAYERFITSVIGSTGSVSAKPFEDFVLGITGARPSTAQYDAFIAAVSGAKPTQDAYQAFVSSVQGLKPSDVLYQAFVNAVSNAAPGAANFNSFIAELQAKADSIKTIAVNSSLDALQSQIDALQDVVVTVDFSGFTTQVGNVNSEIARLATELTATSDVTARLQLEGQLQQAIVARYELEQQMLGGVFASIQELMGSLKTERVAVREAAIQILGGPRVLSPADIRAGVSSLSSLTSLPTTADLDAKITAESLAKSNLDFSRELAQNVTLKTAALQSATANLATEQERIATLNATPLKIASALVSFVDHAKFDYYNRVDAAVTELNGELGSVAQVYGIKNNAGDHNIGAGFGLSNTDNSLFKAALIKNGAQVGGFGDALAINKHRNETLLGGVGEIGAGNIEFAVFQLRQFNSVAASFAEAQTRAADDLAAATKELTDFGGAEAKAKLLLDAQKARAEAEEAFAEQIQEFVIDAGKATDKLGRLREETVRYFQEQQRLASAMMASSQGLRSTVADIRFNDLDKTQQLAKLQADFSSVFDKASLSTGDALAAAGTDLDALINPILQTASEVFASGEEFQAIKNAILTQAETVAARIESLTPINYQKESLDLLDTIDTTLGLIENNTKSAEQLIVDAIGVSANRTVGALSEIYRGLTGEEIPAFAMGGMHAGGLRLVGERGPELEVTGPSRIISNDRLMGMMRPQASDTREVVAELKESNRLMQIQVRLLQATAQQNANDNAEMKQEMVALRKKVSLEASQ